MTFISKPLEEAFLGNLEIQIGKEKTGYCATTITYTVSASMQQEAKESNMACAGLDYRGTSKQPTDIHWKSWWTNLRTAAKPGRNFVKSNKWMNPRSLDKA